MAMWHRRSSARVAPAGKAAFLPTIPTVSTEDSLPSLRSAPPSARRRQGTKTSALQRVSALIPGRRAAEERLLDAHALVDHGCKLGWHVALASSQGSWDAPAYRKGVLVVVDAGDFPAAVACISAFRKQRLDSCPTVALLADVSPAGAPDPEGVAERQCDLMACGAHDVVSNVATFGALELLLSMSRARAKMQQQAQAQAQAQAAQDRVSVGTFDVSETSGQTSTGTEGFKSGAGDAKIIPRAFSGEGKLARGVSYDSVGNHMQQQPSAPSQIDSLFVSELSGATVQKEVSDRLKSPTRAVAEIGVNTDAAVEGASSLCCIKCSRPPAPPVPPRGESFSPLATPKLRSAPAGSLRGGPRRSRVSSVAGRQRVVVEAPEEFFGGWAVALVDGLEIDDIDDVNPWLRELHIEANIVVLGDGNMDVIKEGEEGRLFLCGGELMMEGDRLVRVGKTGVAVHFDRVETCDAEDLSEVSSTAAIAGMSN